MILDSSAVAAIFLQRPGCDRLIEVLAEARNAGVGAPTLAEASLEIALATGRDVHPLLARFLQELDLTVVPFSDQHYRAAVEAFRRFGKGRHAAALDFGDCLAYAVARLARQPLLAADPSFKLTDLELA